MFLLTGNLTCDIVGPSEKANEQYSNKCLMIKVLNIIVLAVILIGFTTLNNCKKEDSAVTDIKPPGRVTTSGVLATSSDGAVLAGHVADMGGAEFYVRGVCIDTKPDPDTLTVWYEHKSDYNQTHDTIYYYLDTIYLYLVGEKIFNPGSFIEGLGSLLPNTTYYTRAFAVNEAGITYGNQLNFTTNPLISDVEGRTYGTASIGTQFWLTENLETTKFNDGEPIPFVENISDWRILTSPGYYVFSWSRLPYEDEEEGDEWSETLYNWHSVNTGKLCPVGWHVPTWEEWEVFADHVGNDLVNSYWIKVLNLLTIENTVIRDAKDDIKGWHDYSHTPELKPQWWSSNVSGPDSAWYFALDLYSGILSEYNKRNGLPVRCLKDK